MPHDLQAQFDQSVLEMIERSPVGAVPNTPDHQDALARLHAAHQVYADADHKDGHVTARSLAALPKFHASNLEDLFAGRIGGDALEPNASIFDRYVQSLPLASREKARNYQVTAAGRPVRHRLRHVGASKAVVHDPVHSLFLVPGAGPHPGLPGNYLYGSIVQSGADPASASWEIDIRDSFDGVVLFDAPTAQAAWAKLQEVLESAPFNMNELEVLGFRFG